MGRLDHIRKRYGKRAPIVVLALAFQRLTKISNVISLSWLKLLTQGSKGKNIVFGRDFTVTPGSHLEIGDNVYIGPRCIFEITVNPEARVTIGSGTWISHDCHICSHAYISIGAQVLIGEFVSIRDTTHNHSDITRPIKYQKDIVGRIVIEDDVWIGRGTIVIGRPEGVIVGRGATIGANSVVSHSVPPFAIVAGSPAKLIRRRGLQED